MKHRSGVAIVLALLTLWTAPAVAIEDSFNVNALIGADTDAPTIPAALTATPVSTDQIDLGWNASGDNVAVAGYQVWRDDLQIATTTSTSFSDTSLLASTLYAYYVTAFDASNNVSASSTVVATTTLAEPPTPPPAATSTSSGSSATRTNPEDVAIAGWSVVAGRHDIRIAFTTSANVRSSLRWGRSASYELGYSEQAILRDQHQLLISDLAPGTVYSIALTLYDRFGREVGERTIEVWTLPGVDDTAPSNVRDLRADFIDREVSLSWLNPNEADFSYVRIVRSERFYPNDIADGIVVYEGMAQAFTDTTIQPDRDRYYYTVFSYDAAGNRSSGAIVEARRPGIAEDPLVPDEVIASGLPAFAPIFTQGQFVQTASTTERVRLLGTEAVMISLPYNLLPLHLKTIMVRLTKLDTGATFSFLLRANQDRTRYEALLGALGEAGAYQYELAVFDYEQRASSYATGTIEVIAGPATDQETRSPLWFLVLSGVLFLVAFILLYRIGAFLARRHTA